MSPPGLAADLAAALEVLAELGPLQVLDVRPTTPRRRPDVVLPAPAAGHEPTQPSLFDPPGPEPATSTSTTDPLGHPPPSQCRRAALHAGAGRPTPPPPTPTPCRRTA